MQELPTPQLTWFADLAVDVSAPQEIGLTVHGRRRLIPIVGGEARGDGWQARVLPGGADFQLIVNDRMAELDARYTLELDGGELIYVQNRAVRAGAPEDMQRLARGESVDPSRIYFRCSPSFETAAPRFAWLSERIFVGTGMRLPSQVRMRFFEV